VECLSSLKALIYPNFEIIVTDGGSSDRTVELAKPLADKIIIDSTVPKGWIGKSWGCHIAMKNKVSPKSEIILFTDADTRHMPESLSRSVGMLQNRNRDLLTCLPYQRLVKWWEAIIPAFFILSVIVPGGAGCINNRNKKKSLTASGQYMLFRRSSYYKIGGHEKIKGSIVEDIALAKMIKKKLGGLLWVENDRLIESRMYPDSFTSFWQGFSKAVYSGTKFYTPFSIIFAVAFSFWGLLSPIAIILAVIDGKRQWISWTIVSTLLFPVVLFFGWNGRGKHHWITYLLYPFTFFLFLCNALSSIVELQFLKKSVWRGRKYENVDLYAGIRDEDLEDFENQEIPVKPSEWKKQKTIKTIAQHGKDLEKQ
jgi:chlorobactene glucosyltransferase